MQQIFSRSKFTNWKKLLFERPHFRSEFNPFGFNAEHEEADFVDRNSEGAFCCFGGWVLFWGRSVFEQ